MAFGLGKLLFHLQDTAFIVQHNDPGLSEFGDVLLVTTHNTACFLFVLIARKAIQKNPIGCPRRQPAGPPAAAPSQWRIECLAPHPAVLIGFGSIVQDPDRQGTVFCPTVEMTDKLVVGDYDELLCSIPNIGNQLVQYGFSTYLQQGG